MNILTEYVAGDEVVGEYVEALNNLLGSDAKKYNSKKWWSHGVVEMLLLLSLPLLCQLIQSISLIRLKLGLMRRCLI